MAHEPEVRMVGDEETLRKLRDAWERIKVAMGTKSPGEVAKRMEKQTRRGNWQAVLFEPGCELRSRLLVAGHDVAESPLSLGRYVSLSGGSTAGYQGVHHADLLTDLPPP